MSERTNVNAQGIITAAHREALFTAAESETEMAVQRRGAELVARIRRVHFDALMKVGFTPEQALVLCVNTTL